ncbi:hypothetical protein JHK87_049005 [Glycine soja]|nr:hypothetical protein JHK87_049005 [Glycine soja]
MTLFCNYTWKIYANKMLNMGSIYTFWRWVNNEQKEAKQRYIKMFYNLMYKNLLIWSLMALSPDHKAVSKSIARVYHGTRLNSDPS